MVLILLFFIVNFEIYLKINYIINAANRWFNHQGNDIYNNVIKATIITGNYKYTDVFIPKIPS